MRTFVQNGSNLVLTLMLFGESHCRSVSCNTELGAVDQLEFWINFPKSFWVTKNCKLHHLWNSVSRKMNQWSKSTTKKRFVHDIPKLLHTVSYAEILNVIEVFHKFFKFVSALLSCIVAGFPCFQALLEVKGQSLCYTECY